MHPVAVPHTASPAPTLPAESAADFAAGGDLRELLDRFLGSILRVAGARAGVIGLFRAPGERLELMATLGLSGSNADCERIADRLCGFAGKSASQHHDTWKNEFWEYALPAGESCWGGTCGHGLAMPLRCRGRLLGICGLFFEDGQAPAPAVMALLRATGEMLCLALDNHRLYTDNLRAIVGRERQMMAAEVHDTVAQNLTFVKMRLPLLRDAVEAGNKTAALAYLDDVRETLGAAHGGLRQIITQFRTRVEPHSLARALRLLGTHFRARTGVPLQIDSALRDLPLGEQGRADLYHIVQEALTNIERHAHARHAWMSLKSSAGQVELRIEDDGIGPGESGAPKTTHWGREIMRERAQRLGGQLQVGPRDGGGTVVRCVFPVAAAKPSS